ncbi:MAG: hypothetical protein OXH40_13530 [Chloroflexi bacterium]|nr:hypothetical protein [Chloroflexota bacterium]MCY3685121.1 hypothetical protein [Chloroflexota bacterium]MDE2707775.1 hypothetical protein [Chloroflexota bacterium]
MLVRLSLEGSRFVQILHGGVDASGVVLGLAGFLDGWQVQQEEAQLANGGHGLALLVGFGCGMGEDVELVGEIVGGDSAQDVVAVALEVLEVCVDGGVGAAEPGADLPERESLAVEVVGLEHAPAAPGCGRVVRGDDGHARASST